MNLDGLTYLAGEGKSGNIASLVAALWRSVGIRAIAMNPNDWWHGDASAPPDTWVVFSESGKSLHDLVAAAKSELRCKDVYYVTTAFNAPLGAALINLRTWGDGDGIDELPEAPIQWSINCIRWAANVMANQGWTSERYRAGHKAATR